MDRVNYMAGIVLGIGIAVIAVCLFRSAFGDAGAASFSPTLTDIPIINGGTGASDPIDLGAPIATHDDVAIRITLAQPYGDMVIMPECVRVEVFAKNPNKTAQKK